jgi:hypothetical protein
MAAMIQQNMGTMDRIVRGVMGSAMLLNGLRHLGHSPVRKIESGIGGAFLVYGLTGFDPLLAAFGANTRPGSETNVWNLIRHALPGQGIKPSLTQYVAPQKPMRPFEENISVSEALVIS